MGRILFADSEPHIRRLFVEELQDEGYEVLATATGEEVVRLADDFRPDVVILEVLLPDMSGVEAGRMVKGHRQETRIILFSHYRRPRNLADLGADDYVMKSTDLGHLKRVVRRWLPSHNLAAANH
jgi:DNA-binding response OmpR family regulator